MTRLLASLFILSAAAGPVDVLDRVAVAAGRDVVTLSDILRHLRYESVTSGAAMAGTEQDLRRAAGRLVDLLIVRRELEFSRYTQPTMAEAERAIEKFLEESRMSREKLLAELQRYGFSEDEFKREMQSRLTITRFIDYRFAPGIQVSDQEVDEYYRSEFLPQIEKEKPAASPPGVDEVRLPIQRILTTRKVNAALEEWLSQTRESMGIRYFDEAFRPAGGAK